MKKRNNFQSTYELPEESPGFLLWHVSTSWKKSIETVLKSFNLTHPQFVILAALGWLTKDGDHVTQAAVGKMAGIDPNTTSQILKGLEQKSLIQREKSPDGRAKSPLLTSIGKEILQKAVPAVEKADKEFFSILSNKEMKYTLRIFHKFIKK